VPVIQQPTNVVGDADAVARLALIDEKPFGNLGLIDDVERIDYVLEAQLHGIGAQAVIIQFAAVEGAAGIEEAALLKGSLLVVCAEMLSDSTGKRQREFIKANHLGASTNLQAILAALFDRLGRYEPAATVAGFALNPIAASAVPELTTTITHLHDVLGDPAYESLARKGETMTTAAMATYAYDQIDQARTELEHPS
jgi:hypothetical protein